MLFHYFERFLREYEGRLEKEYGYFRPVVREVVERYLDCGNPRSGFARIRCPDCHGEHLLAFSCKTPGFCPSCHPKRLEEWGEWVRKTLLLDIPHRQVVLTIQKTKNFLFLLSLFSPDIDGVVSGREVHGQHSLTAVIGKPGGSPVHEDARRFLGGFQRYHGPLL